MSEIVPGNGVVSSAVAAWKRRMVEGLWRRLRRQEPVRPIPADPSWAEQERRHAASFESAEVQDEIEALRQRQGLP